MTLSIQLQSDNDAFDDNDESQSRAETARILRKAADDLEHGTDGDYLRDINGNKVGRIDFQP